MIILIVITTLARIMIKVKITMLKVSLEYASVIGAMTTTLRFDSRVLFLPKPKYSIGLRLLNEIYLQTKDAAPFLLGLNPRSSLNPPPPPPFVSLARWGGGAVSEPCRGHSLTGHLIHGVDGKRTKGVATSSLS